MNQQITSGEYLKNLFIIYYALLAAQISFAVIMVLIVLGREADFRFEESSLYFIAGVLFFIIWGIFGGKFIFNVQLKSAKEKNTLIDKLISYRSALIIKYALLEAPAIFSMVSYLLTGEKLFL